MEKCKCPRDKHKLEEGAFHKIPLLHCAACDGVLIKQLSLYPLLTEMARELSKDISFADSMEPVPDKGNNVSCPKCYAQMENYGYMGGRKVIIDCCSQCEALWIDTNELAAMCFLNERANKRIAHQRESAKEHQRHMDKHIVIDTMRNAYARAFILGGMFF